MISVLNKLMIYRKVGRQSEQENKIAEKCIAAPAPRVKNESIKTYFIPSLMALSVPSL